MATFCYSTTAVQLISSVFCYLVDKAHVHKPRVFYGLPCHFVVQICYFFIIVT